MTRPGLFYFVGLGYVGGMKYIILGVLVLSASAAWAFDLETYTTHDSQGNPLGVFTRVQGPGGFGPAWKDPSGVIWSTNQGQFSMEPLSPDVNGIVVDSAATRACAKIGGVLPTAETWRKLASFFELNQKQEFTPQGMKDWYAVFPDMKGYWFWSSTADPNAGYEQYDAIEFRGDDFMWDYDWRPMKLYVRCTDR